MNKGTWHKDRLDRATIPRSRQSMSKFVALNVESFRTKADIISYTIATITDIPAITSTKSPITVR